MSNSYTAIVNLGRDPEPLTLGGREVYKLRCAEKAGTKKAVTRWFTAIVGGPDVSTAQRLRQGDSIAITGEIALTEYTPKQGKNKGAVQKEDEMPFAKIMRVVKSATFFANTDDAPDAPAGDTPPDLSDLD